MHIKNRTDSPQWRARVPYIEGWRQAGFYAGRNLAREMQAGLARHGETRAVFVVERQVRETTANELWQDAGKIAGALAARGLRAGDVIVNQLPNCRETMLIFIAALRLGLIVVPVIHIYGANELGYILRASRAKALAMPSRWGKIDFPERVRALGDLPDLEMIIAVGGGSLPGPSLAWEELEAHRGPAPELSTAHGDDICLMNFTSGTTSAPKGVMHSHHSLIAAALTVPPVEVDVRGAPALRIGPAGHIAAIQGLPRAFLLGDEMIHVDQFEPGLVLELCERFKAKRSAGVPTHFLSLIEASGGRMPESLKILLLGGASVPPAIIEHFEKFGVTAVRSWGCTEHPTITSGEPSDSLHKRASTDGRVAKHNYVRAVDDEGREVPRGQAGELLSLGPKMFQGYLDASLDAAAFTDDGFYRTGDIGVIDADGYVTIVDRKKDIVVRGGENISSREVEDLLMRHPAVFEAAVVGWPDERMGERVGVFVQLKAGAALSLEEVREHFSRLGVAVQKTPERLVVVDDLPRNPTGKVIKTELRKKARGN
ncbi:MAG TPA: AMP-binding protein [Burkholderiales bacterium]|nr:AMP-binding protein [Burkholderiales bacterium]